MDCPKNVSVAGRINKRAQPRSKSRTGCIRCKNKRLKCDESKPACHHCISKNVKCGYAAQTLVWSTRHEKMIHPEPNFVKENRTLDELISDAQNAIVGSNVPCSPTQANEPIVLDSIDADSPEVDSNSHRHENESIPSYSADNGTRPAGLNNSLFVVQERLKKSSVPEFMVHLPTELVHHYFTQVCKIFSSFDGFLNPFRTTISKLFQSSAPIYYAIQSMAAAYLANHFPRMALVGVQMQQEAYKCLYQNQLLKTSSAEELDRILLSMLLVGQTTAWHNTSDLGLQHLDMAKKLNKRRRALQNAACGRKIRRQNQFFDQCLVYWEMVTSYVADGEDEVDNTGSLRDGTPAADDADVNGNENWIFPHPWTGVAADVQNMFSLAGRLIRRFRRTMSSSATDFLLLDVNSFTDPTAHIFEIFLQAQALEEKLLSFDLPLVSKIVDAGDENTPAQHYILLAEAYRCAALLEIYRVFPSIYHQRSPITESGATGDGTPQQFFDNLYSSPSSSLSEWLVSLSMHILSLLQQIPITSGTRCVQPIVFIAAATELRFSTISTAPFPAPGFAQPASTSVFSSISDREVQIAHMREFVMARIQEFKQQLPAKPILKAEQLIRETWARLDTGQEVYWMDVMQDLRCETIFG